MLFSRVTYSPCNWLGHRANEMKDSVLTRLHVVFIQQHASLCNMAHLQRITHVTLIQCVFCVNDLNAGLVFQDYSCPHMSGCSSQFGKFDLTWKVCLVPQNHLGVCKLQRDLDGGQIVKTDEQRNNRDVELYRGNQCPPPSTNLITLFQYGPPDSHTSPAIYMQFE